jgi:hypothetical protein
MSRKLGGVGLQGYFTSTKLNEVVFVGYVRSSLLGVGCSLELLKPVFLDLA